MGERRPRTASVAARCKRASGRRQRRHPAQPGRQEVRPAAHGFSLVRLDGQQRQVVAPVEAGRQPPQPAPPGVEHGAGRRRRLGIAMQAEHGDAAQRSRAPLLAVLEGDELIVPRGPTMARVMVATWRPPTTAASSFPATRPAWPSSGIRARRKADAGGRCRKPTRWPEWPASSRAAAFWWRRRRPGALASGGQTGVPGWPKPMALDNPLGAGQRSLSRDQP